jgi:hypothetical protein
MRCVRSSALAITSLIFTAIVGLVAVTETGFAQFAPVGPDKKLATNLKSARIVDKIPESVEWKLDIKPFKAPKVVTTKPIPLPAKAGDAVYGFIANREGTKAMVGYKTKGAGAQNESSRMVYCDLTKSAVINRFEIPGSWVPVSFSDDNKYVAMRRSEVKGKSDQVQIWSIADKPPSLQLEFTPYPNFAVANRDVRLVAFLPNQRLMTLGGNALVVWDLKTGNAIYRLPMQVDALPSLSPDRKLLAFNTKIDVGILDVDEGKILVQQPVPRPLPSPRLAFNHDGTKIACVADKNLFIWNVADGALYRDIPTEGWPGNLKYLVWTGVKDLMVGTSVVDIEIPMRYWEYKGNSRVESNNGFTWFCIQDKQGGLGALIPSEIPNPAARNALKKASSDPSILVLKPGTKVQLNVSGLADAKEQLRAADGLTRALEKNGFKVDRKGTITLVASTDVYPDPIELKYRMVEKKGQKDGPIKLFPFQVHFARLKFVYQGNTVWESSAHNLPGNITLEPGETVQGSLKKFERPKYDFYQSVELPRILLRTKGQATLGVSQVTAAGIR